VTVLGAAGFLGSALARALSRQDIRLRLVARRPVALPADAIADVSTHLIDVTDAGALSAVLEGSDVIVYLLKLSGDWRRATTYLHGEAVNVDPMRTIVKTFAGRDETPLCIYAGTTGQVGTPPAHPMDGTEPDDPKSDYDRQKHDAERVLLAGHDEGAVRGISLRLSTVFGPRPGGGIDFGVVGTLIRQAVEGNELTVWGDGSVTRDLVHVDDCVRAFLLAAAHPDKLAGRHWLVGSGSVWTLRRLFRQVVESVAHHTGKPAVPVVSVPPPAHAVPSDMRGVRVNPAPLRAACGWSARVPAEVGIDRTVAALVEQGDPYAESGCAPLPAPGVHPSV
jgi:nucleoside-diphosphate-sugar epimerase